jgi:Protein of unknown function (DUF551)
MNRWTPIEEELPEEYDIVLVADCHNSFVTLGMLFDFGNEEYGFKLMHIEKVQTDSSITHWMKLPKGPKKLEE